MSSGGVGQLILAYAMKEMGIAVGVVSLALFGVLSMYSLAVLAVHSKRVCSTGYPDLVQKVLGKNARLFAEVCLAIHLWGAGVVYLIILKEQLHILLHRWSGGALRMNSAILMATFTAACIFPLSLLGKFDRLKFSSSLGCIAALWITLVVIVVAPWHAGGLDTCALASEVAHVELVPKSAIGYFKALPLLPFALDMSWSFLDFLPNMRNRTPQRVTGLIFGSSSIVFVNYITIAVIGYLSYCGTITPNVLDSLQNVEGRRQVLVQVARVALILPLSFSPPHHLQCHTWCDQCAPSLLGSVHVVPCSDHGSDRGLRRWRRLHQCRYQYCCGRRLLCVLIFPHLRHPRLVGNRKQAPRSCLADPVCLDGLPRWAGRARGRGVLQHRQELSSKVSGLIGARACLNMRQESKSLPLVWGRVHGRCGRGRGDVE